MQRFLIIVSGITFVFFCISRTTFAHSSKISSLLQQELELRTDNEFIPVIIYLSDQIPLADLNAGSMGMTKSQKREYFITQLKSVATTSQTNLITELHYYESNRDVKDIRPLWLGNMIAARMKSSVIYILSDHIDVGMLLYDVECNSPAEMNCNSTLNLEHIYAHSVRNHLGYTGNGIIIAILDSGIDYTHSSLAPNIWQNINEDFDNDGHTLECDENGDNCVLDPGDLVDDSDNDDHDNNGYTNDLIGWNFGNIEDEDNLFPEHNPL